MFNNRGSDYMNQFAFAARNVLLCALVTIPLAACGGGSDGSSAAVAATTTSEDVQENVGMIDRSPTDGSVSAASVASNTVAPAPITAATTPATAATTPATAATTPATAATTPVNTTASGTASSGSSSGSSGSTTTATTVAKTTPVPAPTPTTYGVATLDWLPPTANTDGTTLTNLAGYTVYYGTSPDNLSKSVKVSNAGVATYTVTGLASGTWYFAVTSYSADGVESSRTTTVSTKI